MFKHRKNKYLLEKIVYFLLVAFLIYITAMTIVIIRKTPGIHAIDMAGHIGSSVLFGQGGLHSFNDNRFMGFIQNLFYPPAEDFFVRLIRTISATSPLQSFQIYLSIVFIIYIGLFISITKYFKNRVTRSVFLVFIMFFLFFKKDGLVSFQGLGLIDLLFTGLTSQFLGGIGFLLVIRELIGKKRDIVLILGITFSILSHIVIGPVSFLLYLLFIIFQKSWKKLWNLAIVVGLTSFLRLPFFLSMGWGTNANIIHSVPVFLIGIPLFLFITSYLKTSSEKSIFLTICILLLPATINDIFKISSLFPDFHYYRFSSIALVLFFIGIALLIDRLLNEKKGRYALGVFFSILISLLLTFSIDTFSNYKKLLKPKSPEAIFNQEIPHGSGRVWIVDNGRAIDFHTDTIMSAYHPDIQFVKGLYRESNKQNELLSSYLANLISHNNIITNYLIQTIDTCPLYNKVLDSFIKQYAISDIYYVKKLDIPFMTPVLANCFKSAIENGTSGYVFLDTGKEFYYNRNVFLYRKIVAKPGVENNNTLIVPVTAGKQDTVVVGAGGLIGFYVQGILAGTGQTIGLLEGVHYPDALFTKNTTESIYTQQHNNPVMVKISQGKYKISINSPTDISFIIKLYYYPGRKLTSESGESKEIYPIIGGMIARGQGELLLEYTKPRYIKISYIISILSLVFLLYFGIRQSKKK